MDEADGLLQRAVRFQMAEQTLTLCHVAVAQQRQHGLVHGELVFDGLLLGYARVDAVATGRRF